jgi:purine-binding chemotaxis protein CheW
MPEPLKGLMNFQGKIVPVLDLRLKLGLDLAQDRFEFCTIVVDSNGHKIGVIVDEIKGIVLIREKDLQSSPMFTSDSMKTCIFGASVQNENSIILLSIEKIVANFKSLN